MLFIYNLILLLLAPFFVLLYLPLFLSKDKHRKNFFLRLTGPEITRDLDRKDKISIWIHAVSVGEVLAAMPLVKGIKEVSPEAKIFLSTITVTGHSVARAKLENLVESLFYLPFDIYPIISKTVSKISPDLLIIMETEIWPNFIEAAKAEGAYVAIVNGRISDKSFPKYLRFKFFFRSVLRRVDTFLMQSALDRERIIAIGANPSRASVVKNLKYDVEIEDTDHLRKLREAIKIEARDKKIIVAGSTHEGEEQIIIESLSDEKGRALIILAPRHPERFGRVEELVSASEFRFMRRSDIGKDEKRENGEIDLLILDSLGELSGVYDIADIVIVGGSFVEVGGHNVLEPASYGIPVITGTYYSNFKEIVEHMSAQDAIIIAEGCGDLKGKVKTLLDDGYMAENVGWRARRIVENYRGLGVRIASDLMSRIE